MADQYDYCIHCGRDADGKDGIQCKNCDRVDGLVAEKQQDPTLIELQMTNECGVGKLEFIKKEDLGKIQGIKSKYGIYVLDGDELPEEVESQFRRFL
jgi:hypothetical protein